MPLSPDALEGRLIAQRKVLARLLLKFGDAEMHRFLSDREIPALDDEDPGSTPDPAFAIEAALADEMKRLREEWERLRDAGGTD